MQVYGNQLSDKLVSTSDGTRLGEVYNVTSDLQTGQLDSLLLTPTSGGVSEQQIPFDEVQSGVYEIPASRVQAIEDYVIVSTT